MLQGQTQYILHCQTFTNSTIHCWGLCEQLHIPWQKILQDIIFLWDANHPPCWICHMCFLAKLNNYLVHFSLKTYKQWERTQLMKFWIDWRTILAMRKSFLAMNMMTKVMKLITLNLKDQITTFWSTWLGKKIAHSERKIFPTCPRSEKDVCHNSMSSDYTNPSNHNQN